MASFLDKFKMNTAITDNTKLDLSCQHITTADFMQFTPVYCKEMVPGEKISVQLQTFTRLQPLVVPTLGRMNVNNRAFFVPYRTIFRAWNDFITDTEHSYADGQSRMVETVPVLTNTAIVSAITSNLSGCVQASTAGSNFDISVWEGQDEYSYYKLTPKGRQVVKILNSLGYQPVWAGQDYQAEYSALPLLAAAKVWYDWYSSSQYLGNDEINKINEILNRDTLGQRYISYEDLIQIMNMVYRVLYDSDPYVSAWDNPVSPNTSNYSTLSFNDKVL